MSEYSIEPSIEHHIIVEIISDFVTSTLLPLLSLSLFFLKVITKKTFPPISGSFSLFQFCFIESKIPIVQCKRIQSLVCNDNLFCSFGIGSDYTVTFWANTVSTLSSADLLSTSTILCLLCYGHFWVLHTVFLFSHQT